MRHMVDFLVHEIPIEGGGTRWHGYLAVDGVVTNQAMYYPTRQVVTEALQTAWEALGGRGKVVPMRIVGGVRN